MANNKLNKAREYMDKCPDDDRARLQFYEALADSEVLVLLEGEPIGEKVNPQIIATEDGVFSLVFTSDEQLASIAAISVPYISLSGRAAINMLAGKSIGIALNISTETPFLMPADAVDWLANILNQSAQQKFEHPTSVAAPDDISAAVFEKLANKLEQMKGLADSAFLVSASYRSGSVAYLLGFINAKPTAQDAVVQAIKETMVFFSEVGCIVDVAFFPAMGEIHANLVKHGYKFDLSEPKLVRRKPAAPGSDPVNPPRLR